MQIIPLTSDGARSVRLNLTDGAALVTFRTYYNTTAPGWFLDIMNDDGSPVLLGLALVPNIDILRGHPLERERFGELRLADLAGDGALGPEALGNTAYLAQFAIDEFVETPTNPGPFVNLDNVLA